ncbi:hypothetical protein BG842_02060 [Haladaptatus sp. W1]|nr:hypothetical protein BG842_02060 [Haladaptatus sp. W1]
MVALRRYDVVRINYLDGTDRRFDGPFEGPTRFSAKGDDDQNPNDEIIRTVTIQKNGSRATVENPNFDCCRKIVNEGDGNTGYGDTGYGDTDN